MPKLTDAMRIAQIAAASPNAFSNLLAATTFLAPSIWITNNATAAAATMDFISTYVETDF